MALELFISDLHYPFECKRSCKLVMQVAKDLQPDILWLGGDIIDMYEVSSHARNPERAFTLQKDIDYTRKKLETWREYLPKAQIYYKEGNHETRLSRYLWSEAPQLSSLRYMRLPKLLELENLNITWVENFEKKQIGHLWHIHGNEIGGGGVAPAANKLKRTNSNIIFGHLHTEDHRVLRSYDGKVNGAWANPCLCDLEQEYVHHVDNWSHGFALIEYAKNGLFHVEQVPILHPAKKRRWAMVRGKVYEA